MTLPTCKKSRSKFGVDRVYAAFVTQKRNAEKRGIEFRFDYAGWVSWWEKNAGQSWMRRRGCSKGNLCMARIGDVGPYSPENVVCITHSKNLSLAHTDKQHAARLNADHVAAIYLDTRPYEEISDSYGISKGAVNDIKSRRTWKKVTSNLHRKNMNGSNQYARS